MHSPHIHTHWTSMNTVICVCVCVSVYQFSYILNFSFRINLCYVPFRFDIVLYVGEFIDKKNIWYMYIEK